MIQHVVAVESDVVTNVFAYILSNIFYRSFLKVSGEQISKETLPSTTSLLIAVSKNFFNEKKQTNIILIKNPKGIKQQQQQ